MRRTTIFADEEVLRKLRDIARRESITLSSNRQVQPLPVRPGARYTPATLTGGDEVIRGTPTRSGSPTAMCNVRYVTERRRG
jgi:hypothetical protein